MRTESYRKRGLSSILLVFAIVLSMTISLTFTATPVLAGGVVEEPGGTTITVVQGQDFLIRFKLYWDEPDWLGYFSLGFYWDSPRTDNAGTPSENFTFISATAYLEDNLVEITPIGVSFTEGVSPENENMWRYTIVVDHAEGWPDDDNFYVDIVMRASGVGGVPHVAPDNHPIIIAGTIDVAESTIVSYSPPDPVITIQVLPWTAGIVVRGKYEAYTLNLEGLLPFVYYNKGDFPPIMAAERIGDGAVVAAGMVATARNGRWNDTDPPNTAPYLPELFDAAFQWMNPGAVNVLWYENSVYNNTTRTSDLIAALTALGYTVWGDATPIDTPGILDNVDILVWPQVQLEYADRFEGGDPDKLPDTWVSAVVDFVNAGGGALILEGSDFGGHNYARVTNKLLTGLGFDWWFQHDAIYSDAPDVWGASWEIMAQVDTTTAIGSAYAGATGTENIGLYSTNSLSLIPTFGASILIEPDENSAWAGEEVTYVATVTNTGDAWDTYTLNLTDDLGWPDLTFLPTTLTENIISIDDSYAMENLPTVNGESRDESDVHVGSSDAYGEENARAFIKWDLAALSGAPIAISSATLHLNTYWDPDNDITVGVYEAEDSWNEDNMSWDNMPPTGALIGTWDMVQQPWGYWWSMDVTSYVLAQFASDNVVSILLKSENEGLPPAERHFVQFSARERGYGPYLEITYEVATFTTMTFDLGPGASTTVDLGVTIDPAAPFSTRDTLTLTATSRYTETVLASGTATAHSLGTPLLLRGVTVDIVENEQTGWSALTYTVIVTNTGELDDKYVLTVTDTENWGLKVDPNELWIAAGDSDIASLSVTIPSDAIGGTEDVVTVTAIGTMATGTGDDLENAGGFDTTIARAEVIYGVDVDVLPSQSQTGAPGDELVWVVKVKNIGNVSDNYTLSVTEYVRDGETDYPAWGATLDSTLFTLAPGELGNTKLRVTIPSDAKTSIWNTLTITANGTGVSDSEERDAHVLEAGPLIPQGTIELLVETEIIAIDLWPTSWDFGVLDETEDNETTDNYFTVRNVGNEPVNISITGSDAQSRPGEPVTTWTLWDSIGVDWYTLEFEYPEGIWTGLYPAGTPALLVGNLVPGAEESFDLRITAPSSITVPAKMWTRVTLTAVEA